MSKEILIRNGYGSNFNKLIVDYKNQTIIKESINEYGIKKIKFEINFYKFIINNNIKFPIPKIYNYKDNGYTMEYLKNYEPLYKIFKNFDNKKKENIIIDIHNYLNILHSSYKKPVSKEEFLYNLNIEVRDKLLSRYKSIEHVINNYKFIKCVNNIEILNFDECIQIIKNKINNYISSINIFEFVLIHGDCQFNNIMYNKITDDIIFIDPRGYYGESEVFGINLYDYAKIKFALSGYDEFDNREINNLDIENNNINIDVNILDYNLFYEKDISNVIMLSIWLANSHCFIKNEYKVVYSYFIALYLCTLYFISNKR
jgi:hypothetical protein